MHMFSISHKKNDGEAERYGVRREWRIAWIAYVFLRFLFPFNK